MHHRVSERTVHNTKTNIQRRTPNSHPRTTSRDLTRPPGLHPVDPVLVVTPFQTRFTASTTRRRTSPTTDSADTRPGPPVLEIHPARIGQVVGNTTLRELLARFLRRLIDEPATGIPPIVRRNLLDQFRHGEPRRRNITQPLGRRLDEVVETFCHRCDSDVVGSLLDAFPRDPRRNNRRRLVADAHPHQPHHQLPEREHKRPRRPQKDGRRDIRQLRHRPDHLDINPVPARVDIGGLLVELPRLQIRDIRERLPPAIIELRHMHTELLRHLGTDTVPDPVHQTLQALARAQNPLRVSPIRHSLLTHQLDLPRRQRPTRDQDR
ncbi:hypothetical protein LWC34_17135 [Kibdelosporangium philippinense]|uniref:Uncharacterized protein n=2 Tax=Kibdelosporangium philippinense TaxID=211113 RepID=A0ABS8Z9F7_9PSEU|nr:hypothetical protein [Kibdelosporangium philippinense]MCE7004540.1 hypothetical protein [Kibdelosporangium philippinense]